MNSLPIDFLEACVSLDPHTGQLVWKVRPVWTFRPNKYPQEREAKRWNTKYAGTPAFNTTSKAGYFTGRLNEQSLYAHRVVWALYYGSFPTLWLDHLDGNRTNNSVENLREVTYKSNNKNSSRRKDNKTGVTGVHQRGDKYVATIKNLEGFQKQIGAFSTLEEAALVRLKAEQLYGYHPNHGKIND